jgi:inner membrane protein
MASIGHLAAGAALGAIYSRKTGSNPPATILTFAALALAPDLDLITSFWGVPPNTPLAHRGISHSLFFALAVGCLVGLLYRGRAGQKSLAGGVAMAALASHGVLDTMSQLGNGPMLLWPVSAQSYEFIWRPIPGVLNAAHYLTVQAVPTLIIETLIFLPLILFALATLLPRRVEKAPAEDPAS